VTYVNLQDHFLQPDGTINKSLFTDGIHLSKEGYQVWEKGIAPVIDGFMKAPPLAPVKIMLIGDSITEGIDSGTCYRRYLDGMLRRNGHLIDFVGSRRKHNDDKTEPDSYQFDPDHEGHSGKDSRWIADNMPRLLERNVPDVAVIHLGAVDIATSKAAAEALTDEIVLNIKRVIETLRSKNPKVAIVIAKTISMKDREEAADLLNQKIVRLVSSSASALQPVVVAETVLSLDHEQDSVIDNPPPNSAGTREIAAILAEAINPLLAPLQDHPSQQ
jgi:lysophospholipase L1-like esterase